MYFCYHWRTLSSLANIKLSNPQRRKVIKTLEETLNQKLSNYRSSFVGKVYNEENNDHDLLMDAFGISPELKRENRQYWGRELGMCWQILVTDICKYHRQDFGPPIRIDADEPCDLTVGEFAIDTKYRIGSGDSGTLKKFKSYGPRLREMGYKPVFLILREDNLPAAMTACNVGTWEVYTGEQTFKFVNDLTGFDIKDFLRSKKSLFNISR
jgi:hypothetical protein